MPTRPTTFRAWLRGYEGPDNAIADLARAMRADPCIGHRRTPASIRLHLLSEHRASDAALQSVDEAWTQWRQEHGGAGSGAEWPGATTTVNANDAPAGRSRAEGEVIRVDPAGDWQDVGGEGG